MSIQTETAPIAFLHTDPVHVGTFDALRDSLSPGLGIRHVVREDLLRSAERSGGMTPTLELLAGEAISALAVDGPRVIVGTCSTLGPIFESANESIDAHVMRIDAPMAEAAVEAGVRIGVCACVEATLRPTCDLIRSAAARGGRDVEVRTFLLEHAWRLFRRGRQREYHDAIAEFLDGVADQVDVVVLAQASMAPSAKRVELGIPVLASPESGFAAALALIE